MRSFCPRIGAVEMEENTKKLLVSGGNELFMQNENEQSASTITHVHRGEKAEMVHVVYAIFIGMTGTSSQQHTEPGYAPAAVSSRNTCACEQGKQKSVMNAPLRQFSLMFWR